MGLLDKVKTQAASATAIARDAAKDAAQKGQARLDSIQAKRAADVMLRNLGALVYGQRTGRASASAESEAARLVDALRDHEQAHGPLDLGPESDATASGGGGGGDSED